MRRLRTLGLFVGFRMREIFVTPKVALPYFGLPLLMVLITGAVFLEGQPFERKTLIVVGDQAAELHLERFPELRVRAAATTATALRELYTKGADVVIVTGAEPTIHVGPRDELVGRGLAASLDSARPRLVIEPVPVSAYLHYLFPGLVVWTIVVVGLMTMGVRMVRYRRTRFLRKLGFTPLPKSIFVGAQIVSLALLMLLQVSLMLGVAVLAFDLPITWSALPWIVILVFLGLLAFIGIGFALASAVRDEGLMQDLTGAVSAFIILPSEIFFPLDDLPPAIARVAELLPSTQLVRLLRAVTLHDRHDLASLAPGLGLLLLWIALMFVVALVTFRWSEGD